MTWRRATATAHGRLTRALVVMLAVSPAIAAIAALPSGAGTHARAETQAIVSGINTASWDPWISVTVPASAVIGTYTATITHSVY